jgi:hypothetical protein
MHTRMKYHVTPLTKHQHPKSTYEGLHLGVVRVSLSRRFAARLTGVRRVRLSYDPGERTICLMPSQTQTGPAGTSVSSRRPRGICAGMIRPNPQGNGRGPEASPQFQMLLIWCKIPALGAWSPVWQESRHGDEAQEGGEKGRA